MRARIVLKWPHAVRKLRAFTRTDMVRSESQHRRSAERAGSWSMLAIAGLCALLAGACAFQPPLSGDEPAYPAGTVLLLETPLTVFAGRSGVWLGPGPIVLNPRREELVCRLELRHYRQQDLVIQPDRFTVKGVARDREPYAAAQSRQVSVAFTMRPSIGSDGGWILANTYIYLHSDRQPEVSRIKCQQARDDFGLGILTPEQLQPILDGYFSVES